MSSTINPIGSSTTPSYYNQIVLLDAQMGTLSCSVVITLFTLFLIFLAHRIVDELIARQTRMVKLIDNLATTVSNQTLSEEAMSELLGRIGYTFEKLSKDREEYVKWYMDPKGRSWIEPSNMFENVPPNAPDYDTFQFDASQFFKNEQGSPESSGNTKNSSNVAAAVSTSNPATTNKGVELARMSSGKTSSIRTSHTQPDDGLYEDVVGEDAYENVVAADTAYETLVTEAVATQNSKSVHSEVPVSSQKTGICAAAKGVVVPQDASSGLTNRAENTIDKGSSQKKTAKSNASVKTAHGNEGIYENIGNVLV